MRGLLRDVLYGCRSLSRSVSVTVIAVLALTLGIGLTTTMFSIVYGALMTDLPYPGGKNILAVQRMQPQRSREPLPLPMYDFVQYRAQQRSFTGLGAFRSGTMYLSGDAAAERFDGSWVTANVFDILEARAAIGRTFRPGDDVPSAEKVVVLTHQTWRDRYNSNPAIIGSVVRLNGQPHTIVGVMPAGFKFFLNGQLFAPLVIDPTVRPNAQGDALMSIGRLKPGVSVDAASADIATISRRLAAEFKDSHKGIVGFAAKFVDAMLAPPPKMMLRVMLGAVFVVLLIACANVANLLLDRALHRTREVGVRIALGATRAAIVRQFLAESFVLSAIATVLGIGVAFVGVRLFNSAVASTQPPIWMDFRLHPAVLAFTGVISLVTTIVAGTIPAYQSSRTDINEVLKDESRGASSFRIGRISDALVMFEIALSCALLVAAGLMVKSIINVNTIDPGYSTKNVFTARIGFPSYYTDTAEQTRFFDRLLERASAIPGVQSAALATGVPATRPTGFSGTPFAVEGQTFAKPEDYPTARQAAVTPRFFSVLETPVLAGRVFSTADGQGAPPVVIVTRSFAAKYFANTDAVGKRIRLGDGSQPTPAPLATIVGVVGDMFDGDQRDARPPGIFQPLAQARRSFVSIVARTNGPPMAITPAMREAARALNPDVPLYFVRSFEAATSQALWFVTVFGTLFLVFGAVALFLASVGLYAVMAFSVSRRTRELGIRMALGATARNVVRMTVKRGMSRLAVGMTLGMALAFAVSRLMRFILFQVQPSEPSVFGGVVAVLLVVGMIACLIPARRATMVDPMVALRRD
jgi:putative ABC transport system permease protein